MSTDAKLTPQSIITPEVQAAMERLRAANYWHSDPINGQYWDDDYYDQDAALAVDAMLSLFPPGMPAPVEMFASDGWPATGKPWCATPVSDESIDRWHGVFVTLKLLEPTP